MKIGIDVNIKTRSLMPNLQRGAKPSKPHSMRESFGECMGELPDSGEQGQSLVEFTLILPMLLLLATGIMVFGMAMNNYLQLTNAVSVGARTVAINAGVTLDPCATAANAIIAAAPGGVDNTSDVFLAQNGVLAISTGGKSRLPFAYRS